MARSRKSSEKAREKSTGPLEAERDTFAGSGGGK